MDATRFLRSVIAAAAASAAAGVAACARGTSSEAAGSLADAASSVGPGIGAITQADLTRDLYIFAGDAMRGREGGTLDEMRAAVWLADRMREIGIEPASPDGSYFQWLPMRRFRESDGSRILLGTTPITLNTDGVMLAPVDASIDAPLVFLAPDAPVEASVVRGKAVATIMVTPPPAATPAAGARRGQAGGAGAVRTIANRYLELGAVAVIVAADSAADAGFGRATDAIVRGRYGVDTATAATAYWPDKTSTPYRPQSPPILWVRRGFANVLRTSSHVTMQLSTENFLYPSVNIVGRIPGTDTRLRAENVLYSAHIDHDGVRTAVDGDSIWNGADDNGSAAVALLAIARAYKKAPSRRSVLFVWHGSEERGLIGSRYFVMHPVVPMSSIVAVLNGEMIGRNDPDTMTILGGQSPHRNSTALVAMTKRANDEVAHFKLDTLWDAESHPQGWYFRSDHLPYARIGIPAVAFTSDLHADYHTPRDEPSRINYAKLTRVAKWMYETGWLVANADQRPALDPGFKLER